MLKTYMQLYINSLAKEWQYKNPIEQFATLYGAGKRYFRFSYTNLM